jgi:hypothetical protein
MLQKSRSSSTKLLKFALVLPLLMAMVVYTSCSEETASADLPAKSGENSDVMTKIEELSEAIMAKGDLTEDERRALEFLATPAKEGDKIYESVEDYLRDTDGKVVNGERVVQYQNLEDMPVPFAAVDRVPIYPGCSGSNEELKKCMSQKLTQFIVDTFDTKKASSLGLTGKQRIAAIFKIDTEGNVIDIKARAPHPELELETIRVIEQVPQMTPGENEGKPVEVLYSVPIIFEVSE